MFSVKRPLRFLSHKLDLSDDQLLVVADILSDYRLDRDAADVERRRAKKALTTALKTDTFDREAADAAVERQHQVHRELQERFVDALERLHGALDESQREKLAFLLGSLDLEV